MRRPAAGRDARYDVDVVSWMFQNDAVWQPNISVAMRQAASATYCGVWPTVHLLRESEEPLEGVAHLQRRGHVDHGDESVGSVASVGQRAEIEKVRPTAGMNLAHHHRRWSPTTRALQLARERRREPRDQLGERSVHPLVAHEQGAESRVGVAAAQAGTREQTHRSRGRLECAAYPFVACLDLLEVMLQSRTQMVGHEAGDEGDEHPDGHGRVGRGAVEMMCRIGDEEDEETL
jgi:hypothetical protein